ncbi:MAG: tRNA dihydrouridine synthase DusB [Deltaproteobacteria bacterium]|nr:tRNA dihydrouridine synthase DusB [Deltaproteobacteria bacterium]MBN2670825.1 tRNA dihydrouridine synthase DusB [Deltaproteobacteria bacterium]
MLQIGKYAFHRGAILAPMAGITNPPFRQLCCELGAMYSVTELISCHAVVYFDSKARNREKKRGQKTLLLMDRYEGEHPHVVQLYGREPELMAQAAQIVEREGAEIIDLNFGCPARKVIKNGMGCGVALMRDPDLLGEITRRVVDAVKIPVTAKTRIGYGPAEKNGLEVAKIMAQAGVQLIMIHGRTRDQGHSGPVDLAYMKEIVDAVSVPVVGNGGIASKADADTMMEKTGCAAVAIGQGAKGNPWIFSEIAGTGEQPNLTARVATCRRHLALYVAWGGEQRAVTEMRKHACWYLKGFDGAAAFRKRLGEATSEAAFNRLLDEVPPQ